MHKKVSRCSTLHSRSIRCVALGVEDYSNRIPCWDMSVPVAVSYRNTAAVSPLKASKAPCGSRFVQAAPEDGTLFVADAWIDFNRQIDGHTQPCGEC